MHYRKLRTQYKRFLEEDRRRQDRNERILRSLERIESRVAMLVAKTERLKLLRQQYQNYLDRVYRAKRVEKHEAKPKIVVDDGNDVVQSYLQNLSSNKLREMLRKEEESRARLPLTLPTDFDEKLNSEFYPYEGDYRPNYANSIADDIMTSIYNKPKSDGSPRGFNNWGLYGPMKEAEKTTRPKNSDTDDVSDVDEIPYTSGTRNFGGIGKTDDFLPEKIEEKLKQPNTEEKQVKIEEKEKLVDGVKLQKVDGIDEAQVSEVNSTSKELLRSDVLSNQLQQEQQKNEVEEVDGMKIAQLQEHQKSEIDEVDSRKMAQLELTKHEEIVEKKLENDFIEKLELEHPIQQFDQNEQPVQIPQCDQQGQNVQQYDASRQQSIESEQRIFEEQGGQQILEQHSQQKQLEPQNYNENEPQYVEQQQYDETGHSSETQQGQFEGQYDEYGQSLQAQFEQQQFDSNDQPIQQYGEQQQYDENVQPFQDQQQYDESGQPIQVQQYDENGQPIQVQQYDENGQPIQVQQYDENGQPIQQYTDQQYDENGQLIQQYDETGQPIQQYDEQYGQQYDDQGQYLQQYDESGQPIPMQQYDETGQLIQQQYDETGQLIQQQYDESGQPVQQYDESGLLIQQYDETGQLLQQQYDETGQPIQQQYDETGQPIQQQYDESGQPIQQYDETGQYLQQYDENGQPIQQYDEQQYYTEQSDVQYDETGQVIRQNDQVYAEGVVEQQEHPTEGEISEAVKEGEASLSQAEEPKKSNVMEMLDTDTESIKQETKVSHDSDFDFSNE